MKTQAELDIENKLPRIHLRAAREFPGAVEIRQGSCAIYVHAREVGEFCRILAEWTAENVPAAPSPLDQGQI